MRGTWLRVVAALLALGAGPVAGVASWVTLEALLGRVDPDLQPLWPLALFTALLGWTACAAGLRLVFRGPGPRRS